MSICKYVICNILFDRTSQEHQQCRPFLPPVFSPHINHLLHPSNQRNGAGCGCNVPRMHYVGADELDHVWVYDQRMVTTSKKASIWDICRAKGHVEVMMLCRISLRVFHAQGFGKMECVTHVLSGFPPTRRRCEIKNHVLYLRRIAEVNFFLVNMPASSPGQYGDYYCDANCVGGNCCAEFDINDAWTYQTRFSWYLVR